MQFLKQSTAATVVLGPFVDSADGSTAETALTISQADIRVSKAGAAFAQTNNAAGATHMENGYYSVPLDTTDTNTLGRLTVAVSESGALAVWREYTVLPAAVYDSLVAGTDALPVNLTEIDGQATDGNNATLNLKQLNVVNNDGDALIAISTGGNGIGMLLAGHGTGSGWSTTGGATGHGFAVVGGATSGDGINISVTGASDDRINVETWAELFTKDTGSTYATSVAGSVVKEIVDNTPGGTGASLGDIADAVWDEARSGHTTAGTFGQYVISSLEFIGGTATASATLNLKKLNISNSDVGGVAVQLTATNFGTGMDIDGAITGIRIDTTAGPAVDINASTNGIDISAGGGGASLVLGHATGYAIYAAAAAAFNGPGVEFTGGGGGAGGDAFALTSGHANADPMTLDGIGLMASFFLEDTGQTYSTSVAGSVVKEIADNASSIGASDPLLNQVPGSYASGTAGHVLGSLAGVDVTIASPVATDGELTLVRGDAYTARLGRALTFTDAAGSWPDLTDAVVTLEIGDGELTVTGVVVTATGSAKSVRVEPRSTETEELTEEKYDYRLVATYPGTGTTLLDGGDRATLVSSTVTVVDREDE